MIRPRAASPLAAGAFFLVALGACEDPLSFVNRERLVVTPAEREIMVGDTVWLEATVYDRRGRIQPDVEIRWSWSGDVLNQNARSHPTFVWNLRNVLAMGPGEVRHEARSGDLADSAVVRARHHELRLRDTLSAAGSSTCGLDLDGHAWCWGSHQHEIEGGSAAGLMSTPFPISRDHVFATLEAGTMDCGLDSEGEAWCWGHLTTVPGTPMHVPTRVDTDRRFTEIVASSFICARTAEGEVYCWGGDIYGETGNPEPVQHCVILGVLLPCAPLPTLAAEGRRFELIRVGGAFACGLDDNADVWCWGLNSDHRLGQAAEDDCDQVYGGAAPCSRRPLRVPGLPPIRDLALGGAFACALDMDGEAHCWGHNGYGELGDGSGGDPIGPVRVAGGLRFRSITLGGRHACGLLDDGTVWCWGSAGRGQTGTTGQPCLHGSAPTPCEPVPALALEGMRFRTIAAGGLHNCGTAADDGLPHCWGHNASGQLGRGDRTILVDHRPAPVLGVLPR
jgi:alpha-tubulin suppressor-like RCC1 family protein